MKTLWLNRIELFAGDDFDHNHPVARISFRLVAVQVEWGPLIRLNFNYPVASNLNQYHHRGLPRNSTNCQLPENKFVFITQIFRPALDNLLGQKSGDNCLIRWPLTLHTRQPMQFELQRNESLSVSALKNIITLRKTNTKTNTKYTNTHLLRIYEYM